MPTSKGHWGVGQIRGHEKHTWAQGKPAAGVEQVPVFSYFGDRFKFRPLGNMSFGEKLSMSWKTKKLKSKFEVRPQEKGNFPSSLRNLYVGVVANVKVEPLSWPPHLPEGAAGLAKALQKEQQLNRNWGYQFWEAGALGAEPSWHSVYKLREHLHPVC